MTDSHFDGCWILQTNRAFGLYSESARKRFFPDIEPSLESLLTTKTTRKLWDQIQAGMKPAPVDEKSNHHSSGILVVDEQGNIACLIHSINSNSWGTTGIFVDGVSIPDSASFQQQDIARAGSGVRLPDVTNPLLVLKDGKPFLLSTATGSALLEYTFQNVLNVLEFGMDIEAATKQPNTRGVLAGNEAVGEGDFSPDVIEGVQLRGQPVVRVSKYEQLGFWIGILIDPLSHTLTGSASPLSGSFIEAY